MISPHEHNQLCAIVRRAGDELLALWPGNAGVGQKLKASHKADGSVVTEADLRSNQILMSGIAGLFPTDAILSEESPFTPEDLQRSRRTWVIDPLDGTRSFVQGDDDFSVLVALCVDFVPVYGIMFFPARQLFVTAHERAAALCNGVALAVSRTQSLAPGRVYIRNFECRRPEIASPMMDSGLALLKVAQGELDGAIIRMTTHREWDIAAPAAIIRSAGGVVANETQLSIRFGTGRIDFQYLIASNGLIHKELQAVI
jgi:fructose-1,6-bisphosphatase/inositol monophosphatase family enzyme